MCENVGGTYKFIRLPKAQELNADSILIPSTQLLDYTGTTPKADVGATKGWLFADDTPKTTSCIHTMIDCPKGWSRMAIKVIWLNVTGNTGNLSLSLDYSLINENSTVTTNTLSAGFGGGATGIVNNVTYFSNITLSGTDKALALKLSRNLSDGLSGDIIVLGIELVRLS